MKIKALTSAVLILMTSLLIQKPVEFTAFPTVLLVTTLFRLGLNLASTRLILSHGHEGGDPAGTGMGGPGYRFADETKGSPHKFDKPGKLAMANAGPGTNGSQFFITTAPTLWLTGNHTIFGEVVEGQDIAEKITGVPRNSQDKPHKPVVLESVTIERVA